MSNRINLPVFVPNVPEYSVEDGMFFVRIDLGDGQTFVSVYKPSTFIEANRRASDAIEAFLERKAPVYLGCKR